MIERWQYFMTKITLTTGTGCSSIVQLIADVRNKRYKGVWYPVQKQKVPGTV